MCHEVVAALIIQSNIATRTDWTSPGRSRLIGTMVTVTLGATAVRICK